MRKLTLPSCLPVTDSDTVYFSAGFFQGYSGTGRHFSISYHNITLATPSDPNSLQTTELFSTISANNNWLRFPVTFVGSYRADYAVTFPAITASDYQFWFVFLRENLVSSDVIYSRLVRICRNDPGSTPTSAYDPQYFTTYMKARIFCEREKPSGLEFITGTLDYQYNSISETTPTMLINQLRECTAVCVLASVPEQLEPRSLGVEALDSCLPSAASFAFSQEGRYYGNGVQQQLLYGTFTGPMYELPWQQHQAASLLC